MFHGPIFSEVCSRLQNITVFFLFAYFQERVGGLVLSKLKKNYQFIRSSLSRCRHLLRISVLLFKEISLFSMIINVFSIIQSWQDLVSFLYVGANTLILQVIVKGLYCYIYSLWLMVNCILSFYNVLLKDKPEMICKIIILR